MIQKLIAILAFSAIIAADPAVAQQVMAAKSGQRISKKDLIAKPATPADENPGTLKRVYKFFARTMQKDSIHRKLVEQYNSALQPSRLDYDVIVRRVVGQQLPRRDMKAVAKSFTDESTAAAGKTAGEESKFIRELSQGFDFDFDLANPFVDDEPSRQVRYGLLPRANGSNEVSIGRIEARTPVVVQTPAPAPQGERSLIERASSTRFSGALAPKGGISDFDLKLSQKDGIYSFETGLGKSGGPRSTRHGLNLPLYGNMFSTHKFDYRAKLAESTVNNALVRKDLPPVSVTYVHQSKEVLSEVHLFPAVRVNAKMPAGWTPARGMGVEGSNYSVSYDKQF